MTVWRAVLGRVLIEEHSAVGTRPAATASLVSVAIVVVGIGLMVLAEQTYQQVDAYVRIAGAADLASRFAL